MATVSKNKSKIDEKELFVYGFCSSQLYIDFRDKIDRRLKILMVELAKYYNDTTRLKKDDIDEMLLEQYKTFWTLAEPSLKNFNEETQSILDLPPNCISKDMSPNKMVHQGKELEAEINTLQEQFEKETWFLLELKQRQTSVNTVCLPLIGQLQASKSKSADLKRSEALENFDKRRKEPVEIIFANLDQKAIGHFTATIVECNDDRRMLDFYKNDLN